MFGFGASGETRAAARALHSLGPAAMPVELWAVERAGLAVLPALLGRPTAACIAAGASAQPVPGKLLVGKFGPAGDRDGGGRGSVGRGEGGLRGIAASGRWFAPASRP